MSGQSCCKNKLFTFSKRNYLEDYGNIESKKIDMTLSGTYLYKYPFNHIKKYRLDKYPNHSESQLLIENIKKKFSLYDKNYEIILGPGSNGLIQNICKTLLKENDVLVTPYLSFGQAEFAATSFGAITKRVYLDNNYNINLNYFDKVIDKDTKLIYICNPNNPTGLIIENEEILNFAKKHPSIYIMIDESNIEFSNRESLLRKELLQNLIILKSFSKAYGLSNLRIGYLVCSKVLSEKYKRLVTINEFSGISVYYANKAICSDYYKINVEKIHKELRYLAYYLNSIGIETFNTLSNTLFTKTIFDFNFIKEMENHNISMVPIIDQNNDLHFRIACQTHKINKLFIKELYKIDNIRKYILL